MPIGDKGMPLNFMHTGERKEAFSWYTVPIVKVLVKRALLEHKGA
jgi:hypothetical protein